MSLAKDLIDNKPREISGSSSSNRFQFQKDWAICKLLELQLSDQEYVLVLDFHEDILIIDSDRSPQEAKFFQIKSKGNDNWKLSNLIYSKEGTKSFLGKLYHNKSIFPNNNIQLNFVSNAHYKIRLRNEESEDASLHYKDICINQLGDKEFRKINEKIKKEFSLTSDPDFKDVTYLRVTELGIESHDVYTKGKIADYFNSLDSGTRVNAVAAYKTLSSEFEKRNDYEWAIQSFEEMITYKGITKKIFNQFINDLIQHSQVYNDWNNIEHNLLSNNLPLNVIKKLKHKWRNYELNRLNSENIVLQEIKHNIVLLIQEAIDENFTDYGMMMEMIFARYSSKHTIIPLLYDEYDIKAIILMEYCLC